MAQDINRVILIGNVVRDFELQKTQSGISKASFSIATNRPRAQDGTQNADYPQIVAWRKTAEICAQYLHKGSRVAVEGRIQTRSYDKDGRKIYVTEVVADTVQFLSPRNQQEQSAYSAPVDDGGSDDFKEVQDDDLPF